MTLVTRRRRASASSARCAGVTDPEQKRSIIGHLFIEVFEARGRAARRRGLPGAGHALSRRDRERLGARPVRDDQDAPQRRRPARAHAARAGRAAARAVQGRGARGRAASSGSRRRWSAATRSRARASRSACSARSRASASRSCARADAILIEEIRRAGLYDADLAGVRGVPADPERRRDGRRAHLRARDRAALRDLACDAMTADWARLPHELLAHDLEPHHQRGEGRQPRRLRRLVEAARHDRVGVGVAAAPFAHLHLHTQYSLLDGAIKHDPLFERVKALGMPRGRDDRPRQPVRRRRVLREGARRRA